MGLSYRAIDWNRQKRLYDVTLGGFVLLFGASFAGVTLAVSPNCTVETLIIRGSAVTAALLLHVALCLGPLARMDPRFLPLLYNRRHLGVTIFLLALIHGVFTLIQFHALGDENPLVSLFTAYQRDYRIRVDGSVNFAHFPFEPLGAGALGILFLLAATSHDFWLRNLGASIWKTLHFLIYAAYGLVLGHVALGVLQSERSLAYPVILGVGFSVVAGLHLVAARKERNRDLPAGPIEMSGFQAVCRPEEVPEGRANVVTINGRRLAVWRHRNGFHVTSNVCRHQGGPLGEGRILEGCITCPWHGWNYQPEDGCRPPPFHEVVETFPVRVSEGKIWVNPTAHPLKTRTPAASAAVTV